MTPFREIMLIDDDEDDREIFLDIVGKMFPQINCVIAGNGQEALDKLVTGQFRPDLIFLDLNMPLMTGQQFLHEVGRHDDLKDIPVVILSTSWDAGTILEATRLGAVHFVTKPDKFVEWQESLRKVLMNPAFSH